MYSLDDNAEFEYLLRPTACSVVRQGGCAGATGTVTVVFKSVLSFRRLKLTFITSVPNVMTL